MKRPHVVILGAGASRAACPNGDRNGKAIPLIADLIRVCELDKLTDFDRFASCEADFEAIYSQLVSNGTNENLVAQIENRIFKYFESLELDAEPTLYDRLVLSLREKDLIASFNWDPLLVQAVARNSRYAPMPRTIFLHGNVAIGYCVHDTKVYVRPPGDNCPICANGVVRPPLLFPVTNKNYQVDHYIAQSWKWLEQELDAAYLLTIFGYRAPTTDIEANTLLRKAWDPGKSPQYKTMEIIDIRSNSELEETWREFFPTTYYRLLNTLDDSFLNRFPRRSCESVFGIEMNGFEYAEEIGEYCIPKTASWIPLLQWFKPLADIENSSN